MKKNNNKQNKVTLVFHDAALEAAFQVNHAKKVFVQIRVAIIIAAIFYAFFSILDFIIIPDKPITALIVRFVFAIPLIVLGYLVTYRLYFRKRLQWVVCGIIIIAGIGIALIAIYYEDTRSDIFYTGVLLPIFWAFLFSGLRFVNAVKVSLLLILIYEILFFGFSTAHIHTLIGINFFIFTSFVIGVLGGYNIESYYRRDFIHQRVIKSEKQKNEKLLLNILPKSIAEELKAGATTIARDYDEITVLFADLVGFSKLSRHHSAQEIVRILNEIFSAFDSLTDKYNLEKIKTIGDAYMVTSNMSAERPNTVESVAEFSLQLLDALHKYNIATQQQIQIRVGIHTGPAVAGVIGVKKFIYDVWGRTVNIASRMESHSLANRIQVSGATYQLLKERFVFESRGEIDIKGMGKMNVYFLNGCRC